MWSAGLLYRKSENKVAYENPEYQVKFGMWSADLWSERSGIHTRRGSFTAVSKPIFCNQILVRKLLPRPIWSRSFSTSPIVKFQHYHNQFVSTTFADTSNNSSIVYLCSWSARLSSRISLILIKLSRTFTDCYYSRKCQNYTAISEWSRFQGYLNSRG